MYEKEASSTVTYTSICRGLGKLLLKCRVIFVLTLML